MDNPFYAVLCIAAHSVNIQTITLTHWSRRQFLSTHFRVHFSLRVKWSTIKDKTSPLFISPVNLRFFFPVPWKITNRQTKRKFQTEQKYREQMRENDEDAIGIGNGVSKDASQRNASSHHCKRYIVLYAYTEMMAYALYERIVTFPRLYYCLTLISSL